MQSSTQIKVRSISPRDPDCSRLISALDKYQLELYPAESNHLDSVDELEQPGVYFVGAFLNDALSGIGALKLIRDEPMYGEIKRVYVPPEYRGHGVSVRLMAALESRAVSLNLELLRLETGIYQPQAIGLYRKLGYAERGPFGDYPVDDPMSVFMEKRLPVDTGKSLELDS